VGSVTKELGCSIQELRQHLEALFYPNSETGETMTWGNYGKWHVDHIYPLSKLNLKDPKQFQMACRYTNLQPLWAHDNLVKGARVEATDE
jgi:hypothetical protein